MRLLGPLARSAGWLLMGVLAGTPVRAGAALAPGDVDGDQEIRAVDAAMVLQFAASTAAPSADQKAAADADGDGSVTAADARMILAWASQGLGAGPQETFTGSAPLPALATTTEDLGPAGGSVDLPEGGRLSVPAGTLGAPTSLTLTRCDDSGIDPLANQASYRLDGDPAALSQTVLEVPYGAIGSSAADTKSVDGVIAVFFDPRTRTDQVVSVAYESGAEGISVPLSFLSGAILGRASRTRAPRTTTDGSALYETTSVYLLIAEAAGIYINSPVETKVLQVPYYRQGKYGYCWACSSAMAVNYHTTPDDAERAWVKPWDFVEDLRVPPDAGLSVAAFRFGRTYESFVQRKTGLSVERCTWPSSTTLRLYVKKQILDHERPVVLFMPQIAHYVAIVGYQVQGDKTYVYVHDSATRMYLPIEWDKLMGLGWYRPLRFVMCTAVVAGAGSGAAPVSVHAPGHRDSTGLRFTSPLKKVAAFSDDADLRFSWFLPSTKAPGFLLNRGMREGDEAAFVPSYYLLDFDARLANGTEATLSGRVRWRAAHSDGAGQAYEGTKDFSLAARSESDLLLQADPFGALRGSGVLEVEAYRTAPPYSNYDSLTIDVPFGAGICLSLNEALGKLTWTPYSGPFGQYRVYRKTAADSSWQLREIVTADATEWTDPQYGQLTGTVYYGVAAHRVDSTFSILLTSDVATARKIEGTAAFNFGYLESGTQRPVSGIRYVSLTTAEEWQWDSEVNRALTLVGLSPSGVTLAFDNDNVGDASRLWLRDNWGLGAQLDAVGPCGAAPGFEPDEREAGLADDGNAYFTGLREYTVQHPYLGQYKVNYEHIFRSDGHQCTALDLNQDGLIDDNDDLTSYGIQQMTVARDGSLVALESYGTERLGVVSSEGGPVRWLSDHCGGSVRISDDGSRCLFEYYDDALGHGELATVGTAGGSVVRLEAATGLVLTAAYFGISPDGQWVCGTALQYDPEHPEDSRQGLALIRSDGGSWRWLDTGDVVPQGPARFTLDGQFVVFPGTDPGSADPVLGQTTDICRLRLEGTEGVQKLTDTPSVLEWDPYLY